MTNTANLEALVTAQTAHYYASNTAGEARAESVLFDAAIACGMAYDHDDLHGWVANAVRDFLTSGPAYEECEDGDWNYEPMSRDEYGRWEYS